jgi:non-heme chloroperoxidase
MNGTAAPSIMESAFEPSQPHGLISFEARSRDGVALQCDARGDPSSTEILCLHGLRQSRLCWDRQFADPALAGFRLVRFDLRGHGDSDKPAALDAYADLDRWADDVAAVVAAAKLRRPVLVGWSLGGFVAGAYLRKYGAGQIAGINLVDAIVKRSLELLGPQAASFTEATTSHDLAVRAAGTADFLAACFHSPPAPEEFQRMLVINGMAARAMSEGNRKHAVSDMGPVFQAYPGPLLLTHGVHDRIVRVAMAEYLRELRPDAELSLFALSGHSPFYEEPLRFGRELAAFASAAASVCPA